MRSVRTTALSVLTTTTLVAGLSLAPVAAQSDDEAADVVTDWNRQALGAIAASGAAPTTGSALMGMVHGAVYDAVVSIAPQWSMAERYLTAAHDLTIEEAARLFAMTNLAAADVAISCQADKYHWMFWRPITAIREAEADGNDATAGDPAWEPINEVTPPYPDHPSGWNCNAGAHAGALREFFGTDEIGYEINSPDFPEPRSLRDLEPGSPGRHRPAHL